MRRVGVVLSVAALVVSSCTSSPARGMIGASPSVAPTGAGQVPVTPSPNPASNVRLVFVAQAAVWLLTGQGLLRSSDEGSTWTPLTVPGLDPSTALGMAFSGQAGWLVAFDAATGSLVDFETQNAGATWVRTTLPGTFPDGVNSIAVDAIDASHVWVTIKLPFSAAESRGYVLGSSDGGETWTGINTPYGDPVYFADRSDGWQAGGPVFQVLSHTTDGGVTWQSVALPIPSTLAGRRIAYANPSLFGSTGLLPVFLTSGTGDMTLLFFKSADGGATWAAGPSLTGLSGSETLPTVVASPTSWLVDTRSGIQSTTSGTSFVGVGAAGLPPRHQLIPGPGPTFWAIAMSASCAPAKPACFESSWLDVSVDAGQTWHKASP